jgi:hypothetical protein
MENKNPPAACFASRWRIRILHFMERGLQQLALPADGAWPPAACFASRWRGTSSSLLCQQMKRNLQQLASLADLLAKEADVASIDML